MIYTSKPIQSSNHATVTRIMTVARMPMCAILMFVLEIKWCEIISLSRGKSQSIITRPFMSVTLCNVSVVNLSV